MARIGERPGVRPQGQVNQAQTSSAPKKAKLQKAQIDQSTKYDQKVDNKYASDVGKVGAKKLDHKGAIKLANDVWARTAVGDFAELQIKGKSNEEAMNFSQDFAEMIIGNKRLDPDAKKAAIKQIGERFGKHYAPDDPQKAKAAGEWFYKNATPESLKKATVEYKVSGFSPKELAQQQMQSLLWAMGAADSPVF